MPNLADHTRDELTQALNRLREAIYTPIAELRMTAWVTKEPVAFAKGTTTRSSLRKRASRGPPCLIARGFSFRERCP